MNSFKNIFKGFICWYKIFPLGFPILIQSHFYKVTSTGRGVGDNYCSID